MNTTSTLLPSAVLGVRPRLEPRPKKREKPNVTIAIGFACKDALVLLTDSRMSVGDKFKTDDEQKIFGIKFAGNHHAIIAVSGVLDSAARFREVFEEMAASVTPNSPRAIANTLEAALSDTRSQFAKYASRDGLTGDALIKHLDWLDFEVILAYYYDEKPHLYHSALNHGAAVQCRKWVEAIGCGTDIASLILSHYDFPNKDDFEGFSLAYYAIEACKKYDRKCGGHIQHCVMKRETGLPGGYDPILTNIAQRAFANSSDIIHNGIIAAIQAEVLKAIEEGIIEKDDTDQANAGA